MNDTQVITLAASICTVIALVGSVVGKLMHAHTSKLVNEMIKEYLMELKPNHGSSLRDEVKGIRIDVTSLKVDVATLEGKFDQHIAENK
jgi:hypothetical protein